MSGDPQESQTTSASWSHTVASGSIEVLVASIGNKVIDVVMLAVDDDGLPT